MYSNYKKIKDKEKNAESRAGEENLHIPEESKNYIDFSKTTQVEESEVK